MPDAKPVKKIRSSFGFSSGPLARGAVQGKSEESACIYFGPERLEDARRRATAAGQSLSAFVCAAVDSAAAIPPALMVRLKALAELRGQSVAKTLEQIVREACSV